MLPIVVPQLMDSFSPLERMKLRVKAKDLGLNVYMTGDVGFSPSLFPRASFTPPTSNGRTVPGRSSITAGCICFRSRIQRDPVALGRTFSRWYLRKGRKGLGGFHGRR